LQYIYSNYSDILPFAQKIHPAFVQGVRERIMTEEQDKKLKRAAYYAVDAFMRQRPKLENPDADDEIDLFVGYATAAAVEVVKAYHKMFHESTD
jgi:hypothetical protein